MALTTFGATTAISAGAQSSFLNLSSSEVSFTLGTTDYSVLPNNIVTIPYQLASTSVLISNLIVNGTLEQVNVFGSVPVIPIAATSSTAIAGSSISFTSATQTNIVGSFYGVEIDPTTGRWVLPNGNTVIYPNSRVRQQPSAGLNSVVTLGATFQRVDLNGGIGFAIYTDAATNGDVFSNGYLVIFEPTGLVDIYSIYQNLWNNIVDQGSQVNYPLDINEHTLEVVVTYPNSGQLNFYAYCDGLVVAEASATTNLFTNGTVGFSFIRGGTKALIQQNSFEFVLGTDIHQTLPVTAQHVISDNNGQGQLNVAPLGGTTGTLAQHNTDPAVVSGSVTGTSQNLIADPGFTFGTTLWNMNNAGGLLLQNSAGLSGGPGLVFNVPAGPSQNIQNVYAYSAPIAVGQGQTFTLSGNIVATDTIPGGSGLPAWQVYTTTDGTPGALLASAYQQLSTPTSDQLAASTSSARVQTTFTTAATATYTEIIVVADTGYVEVIGGGNVIFSEPQLQSGSLMTAYSSNLLSNKSSNLPLGTSPIEILTTIVPDGSGGGNLLLGTAATGSIMPYIVLPSQVTTVVGSVAGAGGSYLQSQTVGNNTVTPTSITSGQAIATVYTNETANIYNNLSSNFYWYLAGTGAITSSTTISDGSSIIYSVSTTDPAATPAPSLELLTIAANSTITAIWNHPPFISSSVGSTIINFAGSQQSLSAIVQSVSALSNSSSPSISVVQENITTNPQATGSLTDSGNPSITTNNVTNTLSTAVTAAQSDSSSVFIVTSNNITTTSTPFNSNTGTVNSTANISASAVNIVGVNPQSSGFNINSTTTITSATAGVPTLVAEGSTGSMSGVATVTVSGTPGFDPVFKSRATTYTGTPSITTTTYYTYTNDFITASSSPITLSNPSVVSSTNFVGVPTQHDSGYLNPAGASYSSASGTFQSFSDTTTGAINSGMSVAVLLQDTFGNNSCYVDYWAPYSNAALVSAYTGSSNINNTVTIPANECQVQIYYSLTPPSYGLGNLPGNSYISFEYNDPNSGFPTSGGANAFAIPTYQFPITYITDFGVGVPVLWLTSAADYSGSSYEDAVATAIASGFPVWGPAQSFGFYVVWQSSAGNATFGPFGMPNLAPGAGGYQYTTGLLTAPTAVPQGTTASWIIEPFWVGDPGGVYNTSGSGPGAFPMQFQMNMNWGSFYSYAVNNPGWTTVYQTPSNTLPPINSSPMLFHCYSTAYSPGTADHLVLFDPNGNIFFDFGYIQGNTDYPVVVGSEIGGSYTLAYRAEIYDPNALSVNNSSPSLSSNPNFDGHLSYYSNDQVISSYTGTVNNAGPFIINTPSNTISASPTFQISLNMTGISTTTNANGQSSYTVVLHDPNGSPVQTWTNITTAQNLVYTNPGSPTGQWSWYIYAVVNYVGGIGPSNINYPTSGTVTPSYWILTKHPHLTFSDNNSATTTYQTPSNTTAPTSAARQVSIELTNVVFPQDINGTTEAFISLTAPNGQLIDFSSSQGNSTGGVLVVTGPVTCWYFNGAAANGTYVWSIYTGIQHDFNVGAETYTTSAAVLVGWYDLEFLNNFTYVDSNGSVNNFTTASNTVAPTTPATQLSLVLTSVTCQNSSYALGGILVNLYDPNSVLAKTWTITNNATLVFSNNTAVSGTWTWSIASTIAVDYQTAPSTENHSSSASLLLGWYQNVNVIKTIYATNNGAVSTLMSGTGTVAPVSAATQLSLAIASITAGADSAGTSFFSVTLNRPDSSQAMVWNNIKTTQTLTYWLPGEQSGVWVWSIHAYCTTNSTAPSSYSDNITGTQHWYANINSIQTEYLPTNGAVSTFTTPSNTLAPTSEPDALTLDITAISAPSDSNGTGSWSITLLDPNSNIAHAWTGITTDQTLTYVNASGIGGIYTWSLQYVVISNNTGTGGYAGTIAATLGWYEGIVLTGNNFNVSPSTVKFYQTPIGTSAPTQIGTELTFNLTAITTPSDTHGNSNYIFTLQNSHGSVVQSWFDITSPQVLSYYSPTAIAGSYTWSWYASANMTALPAIDTYNVSFSGTIGFYEVITSSNTVYVNNNSISVSNFSTPTVTLAPASSALAITYNVTAISVPSNADGSTSYQVILKDPVGQQVQTWSVTGTGVLSYFNSGAIGGSYTFTIYSTCTNTAVAPHAFSTSIAGNVGWYQSFTGLQYVYTNHSGASSAYKTPVNTTAPTGTASQIQIQLQQVVTPSNSDGSSFLTVNLFDPNNNPVAAGTLSNITTPTTISYSATGAIAGTYTWVVYASCSNTATGPSSFTASWVGQISWYSAIDTSNSVYILANDGFTPRLQSNDSNVFFQKLTPSQGQFQITNNASVPLTFQLGCESLGF